MSKKLLVKLLHADYTFDVPYVGQVLPAYAWGSGYNVIFPEKVGGGNDPAYEGKHEWYYFACEVEVVDV